MLIMINITNGLCVSHNELPQTEPLIRSILVIAHVPSFLFDPI